MIGVLIYEQAIFFMIRIIEIRICQMDKNFKGIVMGTGQTQSKISLHVYVIGIKVVYGL